MDFALERGAELESRLLTTIKIPDEYEGLRESLPLAQYDHRNRIRSKEE